MLVSSMGEKSYVCLFIVLACHEPELDGFSWDSTVLNCASNKPQQHQEKNSWERQDSNLLGEKQICSLCAMQPPSSKIFGMFFRTKSEFFSDTIVRPGSNFLNSRGGKSICHRAKTLLLLLRYVFSCSCCCCCHRVEVDLRRDFSVPFFEHPNFFGGSENRANDLSAPDHTFWGVGRSPAAPSPPPTTGFSCSPAFISSNVFILLFLPGLNFSDNKVQHREEVYSAKNSLCEKTEKRPRWKYFLPNISDREKNNQLQKVRKNLHKKKIIHRDIKCANVFLTKDGLAKLGDLNVSKVAKSGIL